MSGIFYVTHNPTAYARLAAKIRTIFQPSPTNKYIISPSKLQLCNHSMQTSDSKIAIIASWDFRSYKPARSASLILPKSAHME